MGEPKTNGILRQSVKDLKIGDYILVCYDNGKFTFNRTGGEIIDDWVETTQSGISYFIKVDTGLLMSDRPIIRATKSELNSINLYNSNNTGFRIPTYYEFAQYANSDLNGTIIPRDKNVWHWNGGESGIHNENYYGNGEWDWEHSSGAELNRNEIYKSRRPNRFVYEYVDNPKSTNFFF